MKIIVGFSKPKNKVFPIFSWLIRLIDQTDYSHVYLKWYSPKYDTWLVYHAAGNSLHFLGAEAANKQLRTVKEYELDISDSARSSIVKYCMEKAGTPYDLKAVLGVGIALLLGKDYNYFANGERQMFCSEFVSLVLRDAFNVQLPKIAELMSVKDVEELLKTIAEMRPECCNCVESASYEHDKT